MSIARVVHDCTHIYFDDAYQRYLKITTVMREGVYQVSAQIGMIRTAWKIVHACMFNKLTACRSCPPGAISAISLRTLVSHPVPNAKVYTWNNRGQVFQNDYICLCMQSVPKAKVYLTQALVDVLEWLYMLVLLILYAIQPIWIWLQFYLSGYDYASNGGSSKLLTPFLGFIT
jgi:hypothetical protein